MAYPKNTIVIIWNGGWDEYEVDLQSTREATGAERKYWIGNHRYFPTIAADSAEWLKVCFISGANKHSMDLVRVVRRLGGGD